MWKRFVCWMFGHDIIYIKRRIDALHIKCGRCEKKYRKYDRFYGSGHIWEEYE